MKKFTDLTVEEKADLTEEEITAYVDYLCAERGEPLVPPKPEKVEATLLEKTKTYYSVDPGYDTLFTEKDARDIVDFMNKKKLFCPKNVSGYSSPEYVVSKDGTNSGYLPSCTKKLYHTANDAVKQDGINKRERASVERYETDLKEYESALKERQESDSEIRDAIREAVLTISRKEAYIHDWNRYLELANNDIRIAKNFFEARYGNTVFNDVIGVEVPEGEALE